MTDSPETATEIPEAFIEQVKEALENLYNFSALQHSRLVQVFEQQEKEGSTAHWLRGKLFEAIETLNPKQDVAASSGAARIYNLVYLHYVGGMTLQEAALDVGVSRRQAYRDLRRGQEGVSVLLWYCSERKQFSEAKLTKPFSVDNDITRLEGSLTAISLQKLLENALRVVQKLSDQREIVLETQIPEGNISITTNPAIAQQVVTQILSQVIQQIAPSHLYVRLEAQRECSRLILSYAGMMFDPVKSRIAPTIEQMMDQLGWTIQYLDPRSELHLVIPSAKNGALVLIVDDNQGLVDLLEQYLTDHAYRVVSVHNGEDALETVQHHVPDAILLDLMMPGMDGWELLQRLRTSSLTRDVPVIICSVINDPELAYSLGASRFVAKPVTREALFNALEELHI